MLLILCLALAVALIIGIAAPPPLVGAVVLFIIAVFVIALSGWLGVWIGSRGAR